MTQQDSQKHNKALNQGIRDEMIMQESVTTSDDLNAPSLFSQEFEQSKYLSESDQIDNPVSITNRKNLWALSSPHNALTNLTSNDIEHLDDMTLLLQQQEIMCMSEPEYTFQKQREMANQRYLNFIQLCKSKDGPLNNRALMSTVRKQIELNPSSQSNSGIKGTLSDKIRQQG